MSVENFVPIVEEDIPQPNLELGESLVLPEDPVDKSLTPAREEAFASHVALVAEEGDALNLTFLRCKLLGLRVLGGAGVILPLAAQTGVKAAAFVEAGAWAAGSALYFLGKHYARELPRSGRRMNGSAQLKLGERYDLFAMPPTEDADFNLQPGRLVMRYHGPLVNANAEIDDDDVNMTTLEHVQKMAKLAGANGVSDMILDGTTAKKLLPDVTDALPMKDVLRQRGIKTDKGHFETDTVVVRPPQFWEELTERKRLREVEDELAGLVGLLRSVRPEHPLVRIYENDHYAQYPQERHEAMRKSIQGAIQREFSDIGTNRPSRQALATGASPDRRAEYLDAVAVNAAARNQTPGPATSGSSSELRVAWRDPSGLMSADTSLEQALQMSPAEMRELLRNPQTNPNRAAQLLSALISEQVLVGRNKVSLSTLLMREEEADTNPVPALPFYGKTTQDIFLPTERKGFVRPNAFNMRPVQSNLIRKLAGGIVCAGIMFTASGLVGGAARANYEEELARAKAEIAESQGLDPATASIPLNQIRERAFTNSPAAELWDDWVTFQKYLRDLPEHWGPNQVPPLPALVLPPKAGSAHDLTGVGNAGTNEMERTEWTLEATGEMSTTGYWTVATSNIMDVSDNGLNWMTPLPNQRHSTFLPATLQVSPEDAERTQTIKVSRNIVAADFADSTNIVRIPVLQGTIPTAANIDGHPVRLRVAMDGTYGLDVPQSSELPTGYLEYWLQWDAYSTGPHATAPVTPVGGYKGDTFEAESKRIKEDWDKRIPGFTEMSTQDQTVALYRYFHNEFDYRVNPFGSSFSKDATPLDQFVERIVDGKKANCNVAAAVLALSIMDNDSRRTVTNIADGYFNGQGEGAQELSNRELHAWNVWENGDISDITPTKGMTGEDRAYLNGAPPKPKSTEDTEFPWQLSVAGLGLGAAALTVGTNWRSVRRRWRRARLRSAGRAYDRHENGLLGTDAHVLHVSAEITDALLYDPKRDVAAAIRRATTRDIPGPSVSLQRLQSKNVKTTAAALKPYVAALHGPDRHTLQKTRKVMARTGKLQKAAGRKN